MNNGDFEKLENLTNEENVIKGDIAEYKRDLKSNKKAKTIIDENIVASTISEMTGIPISRLSINEKEKIAHIDDILKKSVIGQDEAVEAICRVIKRNKVGLGDKTKTMANLLFCGNSGVGKCVSKNTKIKIRNKKTLEIQELTIEEFKKLASRANKRKNHNIYIEK